MKRSQLKELIQEAIVEMLPDLIDIINENLVLPEHKQTIVETPDLSFITSKHKRADVSGEYGEFRKSSPKSVPKIESGIVGGEKYVSGRNVLEWYNKENGSSPNIASEFKHTGQDIDNFLSKRFGIK